MTPNFDMTKPGVDVLVRDGEVVGTLTWFPQPAECGHLAGFVRLDVDRDRTTYAVSESAAHLPGREFVFAKIVSGSGTKKTTDSYVVFCEAGATTERPLFSRCECEGWRRHRKCKHLSAGLGLIANSWI